MAGRSQGSRNQQNRRAHPAGKSGRGFSFSSFVIGLIVGAGLFWFAQSQQLFQSQTEQDVPAVAATQQSQKPRFDFYTLLRESEEIVSEEEANVLATEAENKATAEAPEEPQETAQTEPQKPSVLYFLQVGSFKNNRDADSLRANLLLMNLTASVEKVTPRPGETWHRVLVGPMANATDVASAKDRLIANKIDFLLLKRAN